MKTLWACWEFWGFGTGSGGSGSGGWRGGGSKHRPIFCTGRSCWFRPQRKRAYKKANRQLDSRRDPFGGHSLLLRSADVPKGYAAPRWTRPRLQRQQQTQHTAATLHAADKAAWWFRTPSGINPSQVIKSLHCNKAPRALPVSRCFTDLKARKEAKARRRRLPSNAHPPLQIRMRRTRQLRLVSASASRPQVGCRVDKAMV